MALIRHCLLLMFLFAGPGSGLAADDEVTSLAERARAAQSMQLHLMAADLLDELVYQWTQRAPLPGARSKVVLMRVSAPVGLNSQLTAFLENHLFNLLLKNPQTGLIPTYCGPCLQFTSFSTADATIIARGGDIPQIAARVKEQADYGLYLDLEASGTELILRSYLTSLSTNQITAAKTLVTNTNHPPLLRLARNLSSVDDTRQEYVHLLEGRKRWNLLIGLRAHMIQAATTEVVPLPFVWGQIGLETTSSTAKKWLADLQFGTASIPGEYNAWQISGRIYRHLHADKIDLVAPNVYGFLGFSYWDIEGNGATLFQNRTKVTAGTIANQVLSRSPKPKAHNTGVMLGVETRLAELLRFGAFAESFINQDDNTNFSENVDAYGFELGVVL